MMRKRYYLRFSQCFELVEESLLSVKVHVVKDFNLTAKHTAETLVPSPSTFKIRWLLKTLRDINHLVLFKFQQKYFKQEGGHF